MHTAGMCEITQIRYSNSVTNEVKNIHMDIEKMTRMELLTALAGHAHHSWYHQLLTWPTAGLRRLLIYYTYEFASE